MKKVVEVVIITTCSYAGEEHIQEKFIKELQNIVDNGGSIISIVRDESRVKKAYVIKEK